MRTLIIADSTDAMGRRDASTVFLPFSAALYRATTDARYETFPMRDSSALIRIIGGERWDRLAVFCHGSSNMCSLLPPLWTPAYERFCEACKTSGICQIALMACLSGNYYGVKLSGDTETRVFAHTTKGHAVFNPCVVRITNGVSERVVPKIPGEKPSAYAKRLRDYRAYLQYHWKDEMWK